MRPEVQGVLFAPPVSCLRPPALFRLRFTERFSIRFISEQVPAERGGLTEYVANEALSFVQASQYLVRNASLPFRFFHLFRILRRFFFQLARFRGPKPVLPMLFPNFLAEILQVYFFQLRQLFFRFVKHKPTQNRFRRKGRWERERQLFAKR